MTLKYVDLTYLAEELVRAFGETGKHLTLDQGQILAHSLFSDPETHASIVNLSSDKQERYRQLRTLSQGHYYDLDANIKKAYQKMADELEADLYGYTASSVGLDALAESAGVERRPAQKASPACSHDWADYQGLTEAFTYCVKCDQKKL